MKGNFHHCNPRLLCFLCLNEVASLSAHPRYLHHSIQTPICSFFFTQFCLLSIFFVSHELKFAYLQFSSYFVQTSQHFNFMICTPKQKLATFKGVLRI
ncbi:hypothetical protein OIU79_018712 [Salix purpurea]|uniref:Uncharacterized protein n=1 Tax=Salix purpurea TaxID=77065 RepID=A0A9Q0WXX4_SALPP|nr:hypothetical protein OIU79_018712 [Salix purpurea]